MHQSRRVGIFILVLAAAIAASILITGLFTNFSDPAFQLALLRLLAIIGFCSVLAMCFSLLARIDTVEHLTEQPVPSRAKRRKR